ncbi:M60 family metallopeptidase [Paenarthrobacter sp. NPDC092416]|uniref:M60 family metallopeptidase n=1 Tax=Paenarthrobacter sp. NPDC092416 TaxID=3364386 RepID=UPI0038126DFB
MSESHCHVPDSLNSTNAGVRPLQRNGISRRGALGAMAVVAGGLLVPWSASAAVADTRPSQSRSQIVTALPDAHGFEEDRLQIALCNTNLQSTGFYLPANTALTVSVKAMTASEAILVIGAPDADARPEFKKPREYLLKKGKNVITDAGGGVIYYKVVGDSGYVSATLDAVAQPMPYFVYGRTSELEFQRQLDERPTPFVELVSSHATVTVERASALRYRSENHSELMFTFEDLISIEDATSGYDGSSPIHARQAHPYHLVGYPSAIANVGAYATHGHTSFPPPIQDRLLTVEGLRMRGWGIYHELGHQHQQVTYKPTSLTEVTVNIYSLAVNASFAKKYGQQPRLHVPDATTGLTPWESAVPLIGSEGAVYGITFDGMERLVMFEQLRLGFKNFWPTLHKIIREERPPKGDYWDEEFRLRNFVVWASKAAKADLSDFFLKWGFVVDDDARARIAAVGLIPPVTDPTTIRDETQLMLAKQIQAQKSLAARSAFEEAGVE